MNRPWRDTFIPLFIVCVVSLALIGLVLPPGRVVTAQTVHEDARPGEDASPVEDALPIEDAAFEPAPESLPQQAISPPCDANRIESIANPNQPEGAAPTPPPQIPKPLGYYEYRFDKSFGGYGLGHGYFQSPVDIGVDDEDNIYVCDKEGERIQRFNAEGYFREEWERISIDLSDFNQSNNMNEPQALHVDYKESVGMTFIYVSDTKNNRILQFNKDGMLIKPDGEEIDEIQEWSAMINAELLWGGFGSGPGQFHHPTDVTVDRYDNVYVLDSMNSRVQCFDEEGKFKSEFGGFGSGRGSFLKPTRIAYDPSRFGALWVIDGKNGKLHKFDLDGDFVRAYQPRDNQGTPLPTPADLCLDTQGFLYVTDSSLNRVFKYNSDVEFIQCWGGEGSEAGQFKAPKGIAVDSEDRVLVVDSGNYRVQIFRQF
ncbi:MAG: 6-bladed beta-propeller [bacterium]